MLTPDKASGRFISIKADGKFHEKVNEGTDGAILRSYELRDGTKGEKWELVYQKIEAFITDIRFEDGEFGENLIITFKDGDNEVSLSQGTSTSFGEDILKKLPAIDFAEKVGMQPYAFEDERGKLKQGVSIWQKSDKVMSAFWDGEKNLHGFPELKKEEYENWSKDDWKIHFLQVRKFLVKYAKEHVVPKFAESAPKFEYPKEEIRAEDIPFD